MSRLASAGKMQYYPTSTPDIACIADRLQPAGKPRLLDPCAGQVDGRDYGETTISYMSFAGPVVNSWTRKHVCTQPGRARGPVPTRVTQCRRGRAPVPARRAPVPARPVSNRRLRR